MKKAKRIYCIEGLHDWGHQAIEPTVEPMLQLLLSTGYWEDYVHRKCVTVDECQFYLQNEWVERCRQRLNTLLCDARRARRSLALRRARRTVLPSGYPGHAFGLGDRL